MEPGYDISLFIFRRDLRISDNTALNECLKNSNLTIPCFIFDPAQSAGHPYFSTFGFQFMLESLLELDGDIKRHGARLRFFQGSPEDVLIRIASEVKLNAVYFNRDYTPFARNRDKALKEICDEKGIAIHQFGDALLNEPEAGMKSDKTPYTVFTPFFKRASGNPVRKPAQPGKFAFYRGDLKTEKPGMAEELLKNIGCNGALKGGRSRALEILGSIKDLKNYTATRDFPAVHGTSRLSPHNKFGTVSVREVFHALPDGTGAGDALIRQLYWRDFFTHIAFNFPHVFGNAFNKKYSGIEWHDRPDLFAAWREGRTGFPIVDAGMRELNGTGYMHNRVRMITASFLTKDLHIDWRLGERYFATKLADYDPCVNNGSWQWAASTGCDAQPYFRIFNPWLQQEKFDPECAYIKKWIPELKNSDPKAIHGLHKDDSRRPAGYPAQVVDHAVEKVTAQEMFEEPDF